MGAAVGLQRIKEMLLHIQQNNSLSNSNQSYPIMISVDANHVREYRV
jgi:hypothetical protein